MAGAHESYQPETPESVMNGLREVAVSPGVPLWPLPEEGYYPKGGIAVLHDYGGARSSELKIIGAKYTDFQNVADRPVGVSVIYNTDETVSHVVVTLPHVQYHVAGAPKPSSAILRFVIGNNGGFVLNSYALPRNSPTGRGQTLVNVQAPVGEPVPDADDITGRLGFGPDTLLEILQQSHVVTSEYGKYMTVQAPNPQPDNA